MQVSRVVCGSLVIALLSSRQGLTDESWLQFRGTDGSGVTTNAQVTFDLNLLSDVLWRTETPGVGWSSPVSDGQRLWMTAARITEATPEQKEAALAGVSLAKMKDVAGSVDLLAICLDAQSGKLLHTIELGQVESPKPIHPMNGYASPTPVIVDDRVVVHFGQYGTWCLDVASGEVLWHRQIVIDDSVGPGSSPVVFQGNVILTCDGMDQQFIEALSIENGNTVWKTARPPIDSTNGEFRKAYSTPLLIEVQGQTQAVVPGAQWCVAYDPTSGTEIWRAEHSQGYSVTPMPTFVAGKIIMSTGYLKPELVAIDPSGSGDVTASHIVWRGDRGAPRMSSMVSDGRRLYSVSDDGILTVINVSDGVTIYRERLGGKYSASPLLSGDRILIADHDGNATVFKTGDEYVQVSQTKFEEQMMASPIPSGDDLIIRTKLAVYRFSAKVKPSVQTVPM